MVNRVGRPDCGSVCGTVYHLGDKEMKVKLAAIILAIMLVAVVLVAVPASADSAMSLEGTSTFVGVFSPSGFVFSPAWFNYCDAQATLTPMGGDQYELNLTECWGGRSGIWELTINKAGKVKGLAWVEYPEMVAEIAEHTGCPVSHGTYPIYHGTWDGTTLNVETEFHGRCDGGTMWGEAWFWDEFEPLGLPAVPDPDGILDDGVTWDDGPAHVTFGMELTILD